jgi:hypothetical protein
MVHCFTAVLIRLENVSIGTRAKVRAFSVCAHLRAKSWRITFVQILARESIFGEFFARRANANRSERSFLTSVCALTVLMHALSEIASFAFVGSVWTISDVVANRCHVDTTRGDSWTLPLTDRASEWRCNASVFVRLIRVISAIVFAIANVSFEHALGVLALVEVVRT